MEFLIYIYVFIFGAIIGSFLNVVVLRYNTGESIIRAGSKCFSCGKNLKWYELIPVASFIVQKGKCRNCKSKISWQYPIVEFLTGLIFLSVFSIQYSVFSNFSLYFFLNVLYYFIIFSLLIIIAVYDLRHQIIPNFFVYTFIFLSFFSVFIKHYELLVIGYDFLSGFILFVFFASLWFFSKGRAMGFGDTKLALGIGWLLGIQRGILAVVLSFWIGAAVSILLLFFLKKRYNMKSRIAFGPFLVLGAVISFFWGGSVLPYVFW